MALCAGDDALRSRACFSPPCWRRQRKTHWTNDAGPAQKMNRVWPNGDSRRGPALLTSLRAGFDLSTIQSRSFVASPLGAGACRLRIARASKGNQQRMRGCGNWVALVAAAALAGLVGACAGVPRDASLPIDDPNEQFNRGVLRLNQALLDPASNVVKQVPGPIRDRLEDLDAKSERATHSSRTTSFRAASTPRASPLAASSSTRTFGLGGLFDVATAGGLPQQSGDFGQTLFVYGVPAGTFVNSLTLAPRRSAIRSAGRWTPRLIRSAG